MFVDIFLESRGQLKLLSKKILKKLVEVLDKKYSFLSYSTAKNVDSRLLTRMKKSYDKSIFEFKLMYKPQKMKERPEITLSKLLK